MILPFFCCITRHLFLWTFVRISLFIHFAFEFFFLLRLSFAKDCLDIHKILMNP